MSTKRNLLEQAIADAKAVKEMAIANAKVALEEAFEPQLKNLFSLKLQEMSDDDSIYEEEVEKMEEIDLEELLNELNKEEEGEDEEEGENEESENEPIGDLTKEELEKMIEDVIAEEFPELLKTKGEEDEEDMDIEMDSEEEDIELAEILAEIEGMDDERGTIEELEPTLRSTFPNSKINLKYDEEGDGIIIDGIYVSEGAYQKWDTYIESTDEEKSFMNDKDLIMYLKSKMNSKEIEESWLGDTIKSIGDKLQGEMGRAEKAFMTKYQSDFDKLGDAEKAGGNELAMVQKDLKGKLDAFQSELKRIAPTDWKSAYKKLSDLITNVRAYDERNLMQKLATGSAGEAGIQKEELEAELAEAYATIKTLRGDLNEINLLNAKLLYTNKIFKSKNLNESQKVKVLGSFDKASNVKEVKLVFETLNEGLKVKKPLIKENIGRASKSTNSPTVRQPIVESNDAFARMQKLAGII
jgi:hypothetical protein